MANLWLKVKLWTKIVIFAVATLFLIILFSRNWNAEVSPAIDLVFHKYYTPNFLVVTLVTSILSILGWWLIRTAFKTVRQFRQAREQRRQREKTDALAKASKLQTRPGTPQES